MDNMFSGAILFNQPIGIWDTSKVTSMIGTFFIARNFNQPLGDWDTGEVTDMSNMFNGAGEFKQNINTWNTSKVTEMNYLFFLADEFNQPLNSWDTSSVTEMISMFRNATKFNQPINNWNVSSVTDMSGMFYNAPAFNQNINSWNTSSVTNMASMFHLRSGLVGNFNQPLNNWDVSNVTNMSSMFGTTGGTNGRGAFNQDIGDWDVSSVTNMATMFKGHRKFNKDLSNWNVASVSHFGLMFDQARAYNNGGVSLSCWDTSSATNMDWMFYVSLINQDLSKWCVNLISNLPTGFGNSSGTNPTWGAACSGNSAVISFDDETRTFGDAIFTVTATSNKLGIPITYSVADTSIATIDGSSGEITILKPGTTNVTASQNDGSCISGSSNMTLTINKKNTNINVSDIILTYGDSDYTITASSSSTSSNFTYSIADGSIASITGSLLSTLKVGSTSITVSQDPDNYYNPVSKVFNLTINKGTPTIDFPEITKNYGDPDFTPIVNSSSNGAKTFTISDTNIASTSDGTNLKIEGVGETIVSVSIAPSENYNGITAQTTLKINKGIPQIVFDDVTKSFGDQDFTLSAQSFDGAIFSYSIDDTSLANINNDNVSIIKGGSSFITASLPETNLYLAGSASATLTINKGSLDVSWYDSILIKVITIGQFELIVPT
jgi:surface protein